MDLGWSGISYLLIMEEENFCNRASRRISYVNSSNRKSSSITYGRS